MQWPFGYEMNIEEQIVFKQSLLLMEVYLYSIMIYSSICRRYSIAIETCTKSFFF